MNYTSHTVARSLFGRWLGWLHGARSARLRGDRAAAAILLGRAAEARSEIMAAIRDRLSQGLASISLRERWLLSAGALRHAVRFG